MRAPVQVGDVIANKYEIERVLAEGGMGIVVVARHQHLHKQVAIKFMLPELMHAGIEPDALERFLREGRAAVRLHGENVARVLDVDKLPGEIPYMVMEFLHGEDLSEHLETHGPLPIAEAVDYVLQACVAMAEAHMAGIIHRDLKPSNLFLTRRPDGSPLIKVLDFGISKLYADVDGRQTQTAVVMGSPLYMPPEQAESARNVDVRSDIWSLGVILYEATSRRLPFQGAQSTAALLAKLMYEAPVPLSESAPSLPARFCAVVDRCLAKEPDQRYQSVGELATALAPFASNVGQSAVASIHAMVGGRAGGTLPATVGREPRAHRPDELGSAATHLLGGATPVQAGSAPAAAGKAAVAGARAAEAKAGFGEGRDLGFGAKGLEGVASLELEVEARPTQSAAVKMAEAAQKRMVAGVNEAPRSKWADPVRLAGVAVALALAVLTVLALRGNGGPAALDSLNELLSRLGHGATGWAGTTMQMLSGSLVQVGLPLAAALVLARFGQGLAACVMAWWIGDNLVHVARAIGRAPTETFSPITGGVQPWSHLLAAWEIEAHAATLSQVVFWIGGALMATAVVALVRRSL
ncbi:serine/threonine-protein kinase [Haliangium sp.]|uniref:serine/threonine-protein kinase n=1 Tax=Haliangium sp. TaxID=2663208 RepID=UPI003D151E97